MTVSRRPRRTHPDAVNPDAESTAGDDEFDVDDTPDLPADQKEASPEAARRDLLFNVRRRLTPIRRTCVQLPRTTPGDRTGPVFRLVNQRQHVALDLWLQMLAFKPIIGDEDPLPGRVWARLLSTDEHVRSAATVSRTWAVLEEAQLITRASGRPELLREDGSGAPWTHPGEDRDNIGYFGLPRVYWLDDYHATLGLPGKAVLLLLLAETNTAGSSLFAMPADQIAERYGTSLSTVKRGFGELRKQDLLGEHWQRVAAARSPRGFTHRVNYWLKNPFSTNYRAAAREKDKAEIEARATASSSAGKGGESAHGRR
jgi:hypothetical protein